MQATRPFVTSPMRQSTDRAANLPRDLLDHLYCPLTRKPLEYDRKAQVLISHAAGLVFPIRHGIPILVEELATPIDQQNNV